MPSCEEFDLGRVETALGTGAPVQDEVVPDYRGCALQTEPEHVAHAGQSSQWLASCRFGNRSASLNRAENRSSCFGVWSKWFSMDDGRTTHGRSTLKNLNAATIAAIGQTSRPFESEPAEPATDGSDRIVPNPTTVAPTGPTANRY